MYKSYLSLVLKLFFPNFLVLFSQSISSSPLVSSALYTSLETFAVTMAMISLQIYLLSVFDIFIVALLYCSSTPTTPTKLITPISTNSVIKF